MRPGRNDPCPCGSGKKFKKCCHDKPEAHLAAPSTAANSITPTPAEINPLLTLFNAGNYVAMESRSRGLLEQYPDSGIIWKALGISLHGQGKDGLSAIQKAAELLPGDADAHYNLGVALQKIGQIVEAIASYRRAVEIKLDFAAAHNNLGLALQDIGQVDDAAASYRRALEINPDYAEAYGNLGNALRDLGHPDSAVTSYRRALEIKPDYAEVHNNLGNILCVLGRLDEAVASYRRALEIKPDYVEVHSNLGNALRNLGRFDEAEASYRRALEIKPDFAAGCSNLGTLLKNAGRLDEAIACYRRAVALDPHHAQAHSDLVYTLYFHPAFDERAILAEVKQFASAHPSPLSPSFGSRAGHDYTPERRLRIGYVSPDFRNHCQSLFTIPLLSNHDHTQFEIYCYADLARSDGISERLASCADVWRSTHLKSDAQLAEMISADGVDILIDLTMHMDKGRPMLFARKPAPVQVAWLAYPGTTGLPAMDYRLTDPWLDPPELGDDRYTEKSIRLPDTFWCYAPLDSEGLEPNALPALTAGYVTFGCLNNFCKVSDDTLCRWGQVMAKVPSSRLILLAATGSHRQRVFDLLGRYGVDAERIEFVEYQPRSQYLRTYHRIDICLDTLPYNGHTTSLDAYWMGVPVVTQVGHTIVGRAGWSQLNNLGLSELVAFDDQGFVDIVAALASDLSRLSLLRDTLRSRLQASPLMDGKHFAKAIETAYRQIWQNTCASLKVS